MKLFDGKLATTAFVFVLVCLVSIHVIADVEFDARMEQQIRKKYDYGRRIEEEHAGRKITDEEWEKGWPAFLEAKKKQIEKAITAIEAENIDLYMKGNVIDQYAAPVPKARLEFEIVKRSGLGDVRNKIVAVADNDGLFTIKKRKGIKIKIVKITPPTEYDYLPEHQVGANFHPDPDKRIGESVTLEGGLEYYAPNPQNPGGRYYYDSQKHVVTFRLWKRVYAKQERLFKDRFHGRVDIGDGWSVINFFRFARGDNDFSKVADPEADIDGDILFKADFSEDREKIILIVAPVQGGVVENPQLGLNAPESGYTPTKTYEFAVANRKDLQTRIITKSRGDRIYARMYLIISKYIRHKDNKDYLLIRGDFLANPQGSRNLEPWGPRDYKKEKLAERDWKQVGFDDFRDRLAENQAKQMSQLESSYMCQIKDGGMYYQGYLGSNRTFYKYIGSGSNKQYESIPLVVTPDNTVEIEPQETFAYFSGSLKGRHAGFVFDDKKLALYFTHFRVRDLKKRSIYLPLTITRIKKLENENFEIVEMVKPEK